jgi:hypothetical protein
MCLSCGCNKPNERHDDNRNIVMEDIRKAAEASDLSIDEVARNIQQGVKSAPGATS